MSCLVKAPRQLRLRRRARQARASPRSLRQMRIAGASLRWKTNVGMHLRRTSGSAARRAAAERLPEGAQRMQSRIPSAISPGTAARRRSARRPDPWTPRELIAAPVTALLAAPPRGRRGLQAGATSGRARRPRRPGRLYPARGAAMIGARRRRELVRVCMCRCAVLKWSRLEATLRVLESSMRARFFSSFRLIARQHGQRRYCPP